MDSPKAGSARLGTGRWRRLRRWWLDRSVRTKGLTVLAVPLVALVCIVSANLVLEGNESQQRTTGHAANALVNALGAVLLDAVNAETGIRGYAATADPTFLAPYYLALKQFDADQRSLRAAALGAGATRQVRIIDADSVRALADLEALRLAVNRGASGQALRPQLLAGKTTMDTLRRDVASVASHATAVNAAQRSKITGLESAIRTLDIAGLVLGLLAGLAGVALFTSGISRRITAAALNADRLGEGRPLEPVQRSADDLGRLADSIVKAGALLAARAAEIESRIDELKLANRSLETFTYSVSHDLRAPLRSMAGFSAALIEDCGDALGADGRAYAERIQAASEKMGALIDDLLGLSRLWRTEIQDVKPVDLSAEVASISADLQRGAPGRRVWVKIQDGVWARGDRVLLRSVLENLVGNAWKFTSHRDGALIEFGTIPAQGSALCCYVRDNGAGFDPAYTDKLFIPFQRLHTIDEFPGTGVGLASVRQIVERHGGRVWAEGAVGQGAVFYFTLNAKETA
jgi:signal transduction histidine kinase